VNLKMWAPDVQNISTTDLQEPLSTTPILSNQRVCNSHPDVQNISTTDLQEPLSTTAMFSNQQVCSSPSETQNIAATDSQEPLSTALIFSNQKVRNSSSEASSTSNFSNRHNGQTIILEPESESIKELHKEQSPSRANAFLEDDEYNYSTKQPFTPNATVFEIATFVADHPVMANMIHQSKQKRWDTSEEFSLRDPSLPNQEPRSIKESTLESRLRIWLEELKCLFLRTRNPSQAAFDQLVSAVLPSSKLADDDFQQLLEKSKATFSDFRHAFNKDLKNIALEYLNNFSNCNEDVLDENNLNRFVDYNVTKKILQRYLASTRESEFAEITRDILKKFVQAAFKLHVIHTHKEIQREFSSYKKVLEDIKHMNSITLSLDIPTRGKSDILRT
ncbi:7996_t:CDS:2, partial [Racocetra persica]